MLLLDKGWNGLLHIRHDRFVDGGQLLLNLKIDTCCCVGPVI